mmetsp:Transcript_35644/g.83388  ORF Transcript_35644/g.83388 Transcript_35644/m.83388 type:complete len:710 (-) Transcript_35644:45-2174(-)
MVGVASSEKEVTQELIRAKLDGLNGSAPVDINGKGDFGCSQPPNTSNGDGLHVDLEGEGSGPETLKSLQHQAAARSEELARLRREVRRARANLLVPQRALLEKVAQERWVEQQRTEILHLRKELEGKQARIAELDASASSAAGATQDSCRRPSPRSPAVTSREAGGDLQKRSSSTLPAGARTPTQSQPLLPGRSSNSSSNLKASSAPAPAGNTSRPAVRPVKEQNGTASPRTPAPGSARSTGKPAAAAAAGSSRGSRASILQQNCSSSSFKPSPRAGASCVGGGGSASRCASPHTSPARPLRPAQPRQAPPQNGNSSSNPRVLREPVAASDAHPLGRASVGSMHGQSPQRTSLLEKRQGIGASSPRRKGFSRSGSRECLIMPWTPPTSQPSSPRIVPSTREERRKQAAAEGRNTPVQPLGNTPDYTSDQKLKATAKRRGGAKPLAGVSEKASSSSSRPFEAKRLPPGFRGSPRQQQQLSVGEEVASVQSGSVAAPESCVGQPTDLSASRSSAASVPAASLISGSAASWPALPAAMARLMPVPAGTVRGQPPLIHAAASSPPRKIDSLLVEPMAARYCMQSTPPPPPSTSADSRCGSPYREPAAESSFQNQSGAMHSYRGPQRELTPLNTVLRRQSAGPLSAVSSEARIRVERFASVGGESPLPSRSSPLGTDVKVSSLPRFVYMEGVTATCAVGYNAPMPGFAWSQPPE